MWNVVTMAIDNGLWSRSGTDLTADLELVWHCGGFAASYCMIHVRSHRDFIQVNVVRYLHTESLYIYCKRYKTIQGNATQV